MRKGTLADDTGELTVICSLLKLTKNDSTVGIEGIVAFVSLLLGELAAVYLL